MIKGLSEARRLPRLGKIRLGIRLKKSSGNDERCRHKSSKEMCRYCSYPKETDYFVCPPEVQKAYVDKPKELDVYLPTDQIERVFPQRLAWYAANGRLRCAGDNEFAVRNFKDVPPAQKKDYPDAEDGDLIDDFPCPCPLLESGECSRNATLNVILPAVSLGGVYQIVTGGVYNIISINSGIAYAHDLFADRPGGASMIPLKLSRVPEKIIYQEKASAHYIMLLEFRGGPEERNRVLESKRMLMPVNLQLPPPEKPQPGEVGYDTADPAEHNHSRATVDPRDNVPEFSSTASKQDTPGPRTKPDLEVIPESVAKILAEITAEPAKADAIFNKHEKVIHQMGNKWKLMIHQARTAAKGGLSPSIEKREQLFRDINYFTSEKQCDDLEKDPRTREGLTVEDQLKVSQLLANRRKEIADEAKGRKEEGRLI